MKNQPYYTTGSGIRILRRRIKWMEPLEDEASEDIELPAPADSNFTDLYTRNLEFLLGSNQHIEGGEPFED